MLIRYNFLGSFKKIRRAILAREGLSLLETAVALIVIGLVVVPMLRVYHHNLVEKTFDETRGRLASVVESINQHFASGNGAYPCPANLSLKPGDVGYGKADTCLISSIRDCGDVSWFTNGGICKTNDGTGNIIIGGVPFADVGIPDEYSLDSWSNKFIYAVTHTQTDSGSYTTGNGKIGVMTADNPLTVALGIDDGIIDLLPDPYEIFIFSTGASGKGGYTSTGQHLSGCTAVSDGNEYENCNFDSVFMARKGKEKNTSVYSEVRGNEFYDDITIRQETLPIGYWFGHENDTDFILTTATHIGIGTTNPDKYSLEVMGNIKVETTDQANNKGGHTQSDQICDDTGTYCFNPTSITEAKDEMNCNASTAYLRDRAVKKISDNKVTCTNIKALNGSGTAVTPSDGINLKVDTTKFRDKECGNGEIAAGIKANGEIICVPRT